jgi:hypothetical protein
MIYLPDTNILIDVITNRKGAGVALAYQCTVITENIKDFRIPQLQLYVP